MAEMYRIDARNSEHLVQMLERLHFLDHADDQKLPIGRTGPLRRVSDANTEVSGWSAIVKGAFAHGMESRPLHEGHEIGCGVASRHVYALSARAGHQPIRRISGTCSLSTPPSRPRRR